MKKFFAAVVLMMLALTQPLPLFADSSGDMTSMLDSLKQQMTKMQETIDQQNSRIQQLESRKVLEAPQANAPMQPQAATMNDADFQKGISDNIGKAIPWMKGLKYGGDFRLRYEGFKFYDKHANGDPADQGLDRDHNRFRIRLRWGFEKDYGDDWKVGFRLATSPNASTAGQPTDQTSTNQTLGNAGYFNFKSINIDRAYAAYSPNGMKDYGPIKGVTIGAGKFDNPFLRYSTTLVWDPDVTPEGSYEKADLQFVSTENTKVNLYTTLGQFILNEGTTRDSNANLFAYQGALNVSTYNFGTEMPVDLTGAVSYYEYSNWFQTIGTSNTAGTSYLRTNTLTADQFHVLDIYPELAFYVNRAPVVLWYDYARNLANLDGQTELDGTIADSDTGWGVGGKIGKIKNKGDWEAFGSYFSIGANAVVAAFNDSDFGGPGEKGYTNRKGYKFGVGYALTNSITVNWTGYVVRPLDVAGSSTVANSANEAVFRSQADLVFKF